MKVSVVVANHGRDLTMLRYSLPLYVEFIEVNIGLERSAQRNIGIKKATGDIIIWLDSDQTLSEGLVDEIKDLIRCGYTAIYIPEIIVARSFFGAIRAFERTFYVGTAIDVPRAVLRSECPLFDETISGPEDALWGSKIKGMKGTSKRPLYHHDDIGFFEYCRKKAYYSKSMKRYAQLNPDDRCLNLKYRCFDVFVEDGKWKKILRHPILTLGVFGLLIVRGVIYYANR